MAFPPQFDYESEDDFTERLVVPLLTRLGYSTVANYHGHTEYGKDLVVAWIDRFGHTRYDGIQVKYVASIGQMKSHELTRQCDEAFEHTFLHPPTGQEHRISTFFVINGGTFAANARDHFFAHTRPKYGDNSHLLDGKTLIQLDHSAATGNVNSIRALLFSMRTEAAFNRTVVAVIVEQLRALRDGSKIVPGARLRHGAVDGFLNQTPSSLVVHLALFSNYQENVTMFNRAVDSTDVTIGATQRLDARLSPIVELATKIVAQGESIVAIASKQMDELGPLTPM